jgi:hypothetical protein
MHRAPLPTATSEQSGLYLSSFMAAPEDLPPRNQRVIIRFVLPVDVHRPNEATCVASGNSKCDCKSLTFQLNFVIPVVNGRWSMVNATHRASKWSTLASQLWGRILRHCGDGRRLRLLSECQLRLHNSSC